MSGRHASPWPSSRCWCANNSSCCCSTARRRLPRSLGCCLRAWMSGARRSQPFKRFCRRARKYRAKWRSGSNTWPGCSGSRIREMQYFSTRRPEHHSAVAKIGSEAMSVMPAEASAKRSKYDRLIAAAQKVPVVPTLVVHPCDESSLRGAVEAAQAGIIKPVLVGPAAKIRDTAATHKLNIASFDVVDVPHSEAAAAKAVEMIHQGKGEALMKGSLHTDELMRSVTAKAGGLRTSRRVSHVFIMDVPAYADTVFVTDAAINIFPDLDAKRDIIQNAIDLYNQAGFGATPRVAILSAVETVTSAIPSTIEAAALCKMADRGQITGAVLDGPLAFDNAIDIEAARIKGIKSEVAGRGQILVVPDLESGNMLAKNLTFLAHADAGGIVLGARVPIVLTSRADSARARMASAAVAALFANARRRVTPIAAA